MKKGLTEVVFILDRSGSMNGLEADTIGGYNSFLEKQKKVEGECIVSTVLFNNRSKVIHNRVDISKVEPMNENQYVPGGSTALLDAIGYAIRHVKHIYKQSRDELIPEKTIFVITTDGMENSSVRYDYQNIKKKIEKLQEDFGWEFLFLGANIDAAGEASRLGIRKDRAVRYKCDSQGTILNYSTLCDAVEELRTCGEINSDWKKSIEDYERK